MNQKLGINDLKWVKGEWKTPNGKMIPFERVDITDWATYEVQDRWHDEPFIEVQVTRWPRKVTIAAIVNEGIDGYTGDGDGDGIAFDVINRTLHTILTTDRTTFERDFDNIMSALPSQVREIERQYE